MTETAIILEEAAEAKDIKACTTVLDKFEVLCQAVDRGRKRCHTERSRSVSNIVISRY
ncbi:MAG: hypothetical protein NUV86_05135 [Candidatus Scalindua sp.]|nr:hypothetical protein [Candidatus Scalindua sp.]MCR4343572.1 hypothetical protein [Candidatus Scalindua sp.]